MKTINGLRISPGIASGPIFCYERGLIKPDSRRIVNSHIEISSLETGLKQAEKDLEALIEQSSGGVEAEILNAQLIILEDPELLKMVTDLICNKGGKC